MKRFLVRNLSNYIIGKGRFTFTDIAVYPQYNIPNEVLRSSSLSMSSAF